MGLGVTEGVGVADEGVGVGLGEGVGVGVTEGVVLGLGLADGVQVLLVVLTVLPYKAATSGCERLLLYNRMSSM